MKDKLSFPTFTHDSIAGYCNDNALYAQYKNDKKSKYIGTKQMWQELSKLRWDLEFFIEEHNKSVNALIERTKELDKCQKDLENAKTALKEIRQHGLNDSATRFAMGFIADQALYKMEHKEQRK